MKKDELSMENKFKKLQHKPVIPTLTQQKLPRNRVVN
jgi:hypothetical protein